MQQVRVAEYQRIAERAENAQTASIKAEAAEAVGEAERILGA